MKSPHPLFTIVTCTYNRTNFLDKCLESIESQTYTNFEHLFIDGYSTDGTYEYIEEYKKKNHKYDVKIIQCPAKGISNAFNMGIKHASGQYIIFINSDDYLQNINSLNNLGEILNRNPKIKWLQGVTGIVHDKREYFLSSKYITKPLYTLMLNLNFIVSHQATVMHREIFRDFGVFDESLKTCMDTDLMMRLMGKIPIYFSDIRLGMWRFYSGSEAVSALRPKYYFKTRRKLLKKNLMKPAIINYINFRQLFRYV